MKPITTDKAFGSSNLHRFSSPPRNTEANIACTTNDSVDLGNATRQPDKSWNLAKSLKIAALAGLAITSATAAQAAPCSQDTTYQEAVIDTFEQRMEKLPEDLRTPDVMQIAAKRHRVERMSIQRVDVNGNARVDFSLNGGPSHSIQCEGSSTEIPGLENADQGQSGLMDGHQQIINDFIIK